MRAREVDPSTRSVLEAARGLLLRPGAWIKGHYMVDAWGVPCIARDTPVKFSAEGAIMRAAWIMRKPARDAIRYLESTIDRRGGVSLSAVNDARQTGHLTVITWFNRAIINLGGEAIVPGEEDESE